MKQNVRSSERAISMAIAALFLKRGMQRKGIVGFASMLASGALGLRGMTGHCSVYNALGLSSVARRRLPGEIADDEYSLVVRRSRLIRRTIDEVAEFFNHAADVEELVASNPQLKREGAGLDKWTLLLPLGKKISADVVVTQHSSEEIHFHSSSPEREHALVYRGKVEVRPTSRADHTRVTIKLAVKPLEGLLGKAVAHPLEAILVKLVKEALNLLKQKLEAGELATIRGQAKGARFPALPSEPVDAAVRGAAGAQVFAPAPHRDDALSHHVSPATQAEEGALAADGLYGNAVGAEGLDEEPLIGASTKDLGEDSEHPMRNRTASKAKKKREGRAV